MEWEGCPRDQKHHQLPYKKDQPFQPRRCSSLHRSSVLDQLLLRWGQQHETLMGELCLKSSSLLTCERGRRGQGESRRLSTPFCPGNGPDISGMCLRCPLCLLAAFNGLTRQHLCQPPLHPPKPLLQHKKSLLAGFLESEFLSKVLYHAITGNNGNQLHRQKPMPVTSFVTLLPRIRPHFHVTVCLSVSIFGHLVFMYPCQCP